MFITKQDGNSDEAVNIEIRGCEIRYTPKSDMRKREVCGIYENRKRATEVFAEMAHIGWNEKNPKYVMLIN